MSRMAWLDLVTEYSASTDQKHALGAERDVTEGDAAGSAVLGTKRYRYVKNADVIAFVAGNVIQRTAATNSAASGIVCVSTSVYKGKVLGVAVSAIPAGGFGWVQIKGYSPSLVSGGAVAAGDPIGTQGATTAGAVFTVTLGLGTDFAYALTDDSGTQVNAILDIP